MIKSLSITVFIFACAIATQAQATVLATATNHTWTVDDLSPETQAMIKDLPAAMAKERSASLVELINDELIAAEARTRGTDATKLVADVMAKAAAPSDAEIEKIYQANLAAFDGKPLSAVRDQIVSFLKADTGRRDLLKLIETIKPKYKITPGKDINAPGLKPADVVVTVNGHAITDQEFEQKYKLDLYETSAQVSDQVFGELYELIYSALVLDEAKARDIDAATLIASEVSNKMRDYSDRERMQLEGAFRESLFAKYKVKFLYAEPEPVVRNISTGNGPSTGPATAPVTIVMFSDFQCPACSATHPILKKAMAEYPGKIHFVVRNYPLTTRHPNALRAACAAAAANAQGKFFEYTDVLYKNQNALDDDSLRKYAAALGLNAKQFDLDFNSEKTAAAVQRDVDDGNALRLPGTPSIFVNGVAVRDLSIFGFKRAIDRALRK